MIGGAPQAIAITTLPEVIVFDKKTTIQMRALMAIVITMICRARTFRQDNHSLIKSRASNNTGIKITV
jgi:hypothetical protein